MDEGNPRGALAMGRPASLMALSASLLVVVSWLTWLGVPPAWVARGFPSFAGYPKNVEQLAILLSGLAAVALVLWPRGSGVFFHVGTKRFRPSNVLPPTWKKTPDPFLLLLLTAAMGIAWHYGRPETVVVFPLIVAGQGVYFAWFFHRREEQPEVAAHLEPKSSLVAASVYLVAAAVCLSQSLSPTFLDLFHQGEVLLSARDWLEGGRPFETMYWPHGLHDTWLTAQFMRITGNEGLGAVILARAATQLLGLWGLGLMLSRLLRRPVDAAWLTLGIVVVLPAVLYLVGISFFAVAALCLAARRQSPAWTVLLGALLGWAYLWRFETGVSAVATIAAWLLFDEFYVRGFALGETGWRWLIHAGRFQRLAARASQILAGMLLLFGTLWVVIGLPTQAMLRTTLWDLPRYHADNTGFPLPLPLRGFEQFPYGDYAPLRWLTVHFLLFSITLAVFLCDKARRRQLSAGTPATRTFLLFLAYGLLNLKTGMDRAAPCHLLVPIALVSLPILFDAIGRLTTAIRSSTLRVGLGLAMATVYFALLPHLLGPVAAGLPTFPDQMAHVFRAVSDPRPAWQTLLTCLRPTHSFQDLLEPSHDEAKPLIAQGVRELRRLLPAYGIGPRQLLTVHSAPLIYPLVGHQSPTRFYLLGWAMNDRLEQQAVQELMQQDVRAVLRVNGVGRTLAWYDVPDEHRIPIIDRYLRKRTENWISCITRLGALQVDAAIPDDNRYTLTRSGSVESVVDAHRRRQLTPGALLGFVDRLEPHGDYVEIAGWAADVAQGRAVESILVFCGDECVFAGIPYAERPDVTAYCRQPALLDVGFAYRLPRTFLHGTALGPLRIIAVRGEAASELAQADQSATGHWK